MGRALKVWEIAIILPSGPVWRPTWKSWGTEEEWASSRGVHYCRFD